MWVRSLLLVVALTSSAAAEPAWEVGTTAVARAQAAKLRDEAYALFAVDRYDDAAAKLRAAIALFPHPRFQLALGLTHVRTARWLEAEVALARAVDSGEAGLGDELARAQAALAEAKAHLGTVVITSRQHGAEISLDGKRVLVAPGAASVRVLPGRHVVIAKRSSLSSEPIALDVRATESVDAAPVLFVTETAWRWSRWKPWAVIAAGGLAAVSGVPLLLHSQGEYDRYRAEFDKRCVITVCNPEPAELVSIREGARSWRYGAIGAFVGGGVVAGLGLLWLAVNHPIESRHPAPETAIAPWLDGRGVAIARTW